MLIIISQDPVQEKCSHHSLLDRRIEAVIGTNLRANAAGAGRVQQIIGRAVRRIPAPRKVSQ